MSLDHEMEKWSRSWRGATTPDIDLLIKKTETRRRRMAFVVVAEILASAFAVWQVVRFLSITVEPPLRIWGWSLLGLLFASQVMFLVLRRSLWSSQGSSVSGLLELSLKQARFSMKYMLFNGLAFALVGASLVPFVLRSWTEMHANGADSARIQDFILTASANGAVLVSGLALNFWYWAKQRARYREISDMLRSINP